jgi:DNA-binding IclR family transcriptional regulator
MPVDSTNGSYTRSVDRACDILFALGAEPGEAGVTAVARRVGLGKSTVYRLLQSLMTRGFVAYNPETQAYRLGGRLFRLGLQLQSHLAVRDEASPFLHQLRDLTGETATLYLPIGEHAVAVAQVITLQEPKRIPNLGDPFPLHTGAVGKALLAFQNDDWIDTYLARSSAPATAAAESQPRPRGLRAQVGLTSIPDPESTRAEIERVRKEGYAVSIGEATPRSSGLAFPIINAREGLLGAISIIGPADRWTRARMLKLQPECREIVDQLTLRVRYLEPLALN